MQNEFFGNMETHRLVALLIGLTDGPEKRGLLPP